MAIDENLTGDADGYTASHRLPGRREEVDKYVHAKAKNHRTVRLCDLVMGFLLVR